LVNCVGRIETDSCILSMQGASTSMQLYSRRYLVSFFTFLSLFQIIEHLEAKMRSAPLALASAACTYAACARAADSLADVCTSAYVAAHFPAVDFYSGITLNPDSVVASPVYNASVTGNTFFPDSVFDYCSVEFTYSHDGLDDEVVVTYWLPSPDKFENRFLATGGEWPYMTLGPIPLHDTINSICPRRRLRYQLTAWILTRGYYLRSRCRTDRWWLWLLCQ
jgi:hypothetical protein